MHCDASGKTCHMTKVAGVQHMKNLERRRKKTGGNVYQCTHCGFYHITKNKTRSTADYKKNKQQDIYESDRTGGFQTKR